MKQTLILVLSALRSPWLAMLQKQQATWDTVAHPQTRTVYYVGASAARFEGNVLYSAIDEHLHNIGRRTVEALEFALTLPWDYLARAHSSTYVHKRRLVEFTAGLPATGALMGLETPGPGGAPYLWGGGHYVMSRDVVELLIAHKARWDHGQMEDVAMSRLAASLGVAFGRGRSASIDWKPGLAGASCTVCNGKLGGCDFTDFRDLDKYDDQFFWRCKHDPDRQIDLRAMELLFQNLTP